MEISDKPREGLAYTNTATDIQQQLENLRGIGTDGVQPNFMERAPALYWQGLPQ